MRMVESAVSPQIPWKRFCFRIMPAKQKETSLESIACSIIDHVTSNNSDRECCISQEVFMAHISESCNGKHNLGITQY